MRTRRGVCYPEVHASSATMTLSLNNEKFKKKQMKVKVKVTKKKNRDFVNREIINKKRSSSENNYFPAFDKNDFVVRKSCDKFEIPRKKRAKLSPEFVAGGSDYFDALPDDLVVSILCKLSSSASCPADFTNLLITCKRLKGLGLNSVVLAKASPKTFAIKARNWSESAHRFLKLCSDSGNVEACYTLGMIRFYCLQNRGSGASLMAKAAINSHAQALYSLAVIQFNGSGGTKIDKDLRAGVALCARAAFLGHVDALRELGHCLQDGYGVRQNVAEGRRFLVQANARELAAALTCSTSSSLPPSSCWMTSAPNADRHVLSTTTGTSVGCPLLSDFGCNVPAPESHPANRFLTEWYSGRPEPGPGLRLCSHVGCGRPETRKHEFRRCSVCGAVNYCSRACQALDWKLRHKSECAPMPRWVEGDEENNNIHAVGVYVDGDGDGDGEGEGEGEGNGEINGMEVNEEEDEDR